MSLLAIIIFLFPNFHVSPSLEDYHSFILEYYPPPLPSSFLSPTTTPPTSVVHVVSPNSFNPESSSDSSPSSSSNSSPSPPLPFIRWLPHLILATSSLDKFLVSLLLLISLLIHVPLLRLCVILTGVKLWILKYPFFTLTIH